MDPPYGRLLVRIATALNKLRQRGHNIVTLSLATTYIFFIYRIDAIVTSIVVLYRPPHNTILPILPFILAIDINAHF